MSVSVCYIFQEFATTGKAYHAIPCLQGRVGGTTKPSTSTYNKDNVSMMCCAEALTTPVIHEYHAKDVFVGFLDGNGLPKLIPSSNKEGLMRVKKRYNSGQILTCAIVPCWIRHRLTKGNPGLSLMQLRCWNEVISTSIQTLQTYVWLD